MNAPHRGRGPGSLAIITLCDDSRTVAVRVAIGRGANVVSILLREHDGSTREILAKSTTADLEHAPTRVGSPVLFPFPGYVMRGHYEWGGRVRSLALNAPGGHHHVHGFAHDRPWELVSHEADALLARIATPAALSSDESQAYPYATELTLRVAARHRAVEIVLAATNLDQVTVPVGIGWHPYFDTADAIAVDLPGASERLLEGPVPSGDVREATPGPMAFDTIPPGTLIDRTDLGVDPVATITFPTSQVALRLGGEVSDLVIYAPITSTLALEALTCPLSAGSSQLSLLRLEPGARRWLSATLSIAS
ncbi:MAG: aldose 1-epimerase [Candidatus Limnocylindria bacterium]